MTTKTKTEDKTAPVKLLYAVWGADGVRHDVDAVVDLPVDHAKALISEGKAERADPMPGDE